MIPRRFDPSLLPALDALLRERNVTRAAASLHVSQQALSSTLRRLRLAFGDDLLIRVGRRLELTPLAHALVAPVSEALASAKALMNVRPTFDPATARRSFTVAISDYAALVLLPHLLRRLEREAPGIRLVLRAVSGDSLHQLAAGELDLCFASSDLRLFDTPRAGTMLRSDLLFEDDFVLLYDPATLALPQSLTASAYRDLRHGIAAFEAGVETIVLRAWRRDGHGFDIAVTAPTFSGLASLLPGTSLVATVQRRLAEALAPRLSLAIAECPLPVPRLGEAALWHGRHDDDPAHRFLRAATRAAGADMGS